MKLVLTKKQLLFCNLIAVIGLGALTHQAFVANDLILDPWIITLVMLLSWNLGRLFERVHSLVKESRVKQA